MRRGTPSGGRMCAVPRVQRRGRTCAVPRVQRRGLERGCGRGRCLERGCGRGFDCGGGFGFGRAVVRGRGRARRREFSGSDITSGPLIDWRVSDQVGLIERKCEFGASPGGASGCGVSNSPIQARTSSEEPRHGAEPVSLVDLAPVFEVEEIPEEILTQLLDDFSLPEQVARSARASSTGSGKRDKFSGHLGRPLSDGELRRVEEPRVWGNSTSVRQSPRSRQLPRSFYEDVYPYAEFHGRICYTNNEEECELLCKDILSDLSIRALGFDIEWRPVWKSGEPQRKTALLQLSTSDTAFLFHIYHMDRFPESLNKLLSADSPLKVGVGIGGDASRLLADYGVSMSGMLDVRELYNPEGQVQTGAGLNSLAIDVLGVKLRKERFIRCGNWERRPLTHQQILYAATDAWIGLRLYLRLAPNQSSPDVYDVSHG